MGCPKAANSYFVFAYVALGRDTVALGSAPTYERHVSSPKQDYSFQPQTWVFL